MKYGIEVEGTHKGRPMIFCTAEDYEKSPAVIREHMVARGCTAVYISDPTGDLSYRSVSDAFKGYMVTVDTQVVRDEVRPDNIILMLRLPDELYEKVNALQPWDMIKFERDQFVKVFSMTDVILTTPEEFLQDVNL